MKWLLKFKRALLVNNTDQSLTRAVVAGVMLAKQCGFFCSVLVGFFRVF